MRKSIIAVVIILYTLPNVCNGWGLQGHRIIGQIADSYITPKAKVEVAKILGTETIAMASNWPDFVKSDPAYKYLSLWHYVNFKPGINLQEMEAALNADTSTNAYNKILFLTNELKNGKLLPLETKQLYLKLLIHIIGDVHQPMHLGRNTDRGGNAIRVKWFSDDVNLHQVWDEKLISYQELSYTEYTNHINHTTVKQRTEWQKQTLAQWLFDTYLLAEKVYAETTPDSRLDYLYNFKFIASLNDQLLKGGIHLAGVLNSIYK
jgi:hypothetical protein